MKKITSVFCLLFIYYFGMAQNQPPVLSNVEMSATGSVLTITFDLADNEQDESMVQLYVRKKGQLEAVDATNATGDVFKKVAVGVNKNITWNFTNKINATDDYVIKIVADDLQTVDIQSIVDGVDSMNLLNDLTFVEGDRNRTTGTSHLEEVRSLIKERFSSDGLSWETQSFSFGSYTGENYVATIPGTESGEVYILCAHYETVPNSPGADDNGSGVVGLLETARVLAPYNFKKTLKLIAFDLEEAGLLGSVDYVNNHIGEQTVSGVLDFEMIGYATEEENTQSFPFGFNVLYPDVYASVEADGFRGNFIANVGKVGQDDWELVFAQAAEDYVPDLKVVTFNAPANWLTVTPDLGRSDHAPFWVNNRPAVMLTGTANFRNKNYHMSTDTIGLLNFTFMANVVKASVATLAQAGEIQNSDWVEKELKLIVGITEAIPSLVKIFPNPAQDLLFLESNQIIISAKLFDATGRLVLSIEKPNNQLNIKGLPSGQYNLILRIGSRDVRKEVVIN